MVPLAEIASEANDLNLNILRYIDSSEPEDLHDLGAHLHGGIPNRDINALGAYWEVFPGVWSRLPPPISAERARSRMAPVLPSSLTGPYPPAYPFYMEPKLK